MAGATITAKNVSGLYCGMIRVRSAEATTDEQGRFWLETGFYPVHLRVRSEVGTMCYPQNPYYYGRAIPLPLLRQPEHNVVLMRWAEVTGGVVDRRTDEPVTSFRVHYASSTTHAPRSYRSRDGSFVEARLTPGIHTITVMAKGYAPAVVHAVAVPPGSKLDIGTVRMATGPALKGRVLLAGSGRPLAGAKIRFRSVRSRAVVSYPPDELKATTDAEGRFSVPNMPRLILEAFTSTDRPEHRMLILGNVDMSLARDGVVDALFFARAEGK